MSEATSLICSPLVSEADTSFMSVDDLDSSDLICLDNNSQPTEAPVHKPQEVQSSYTTPTINLAQISRGNIRAPKDEEVIVVPTVLGSLGDISGGNNALQNMIRSWHTELGQLTQQYQGRLRYASFKNLLETDPSVLRELIKVALSSAGLEDQIAEWTVGIESVVEHFKTEGITLEKFKELFANAQSDPKLKSFLHAVQMSLIIPITLPAAIQALNELSAQVSESAQEGLLQLIEQEPDPDRLAKEIITQVALAQGKSSLKLDGNTWRDVAERHGVQDPDAISQSLDYRCALVALQVASGKIDKPDLREVIKLLIKSTDEDRSRHNRVAVREPTGIPGFSGGARVAVSIPGRPALALKGEPIILPAILAPRPENMTTPASIFIPQAMTTPADRQAGLGSIHSVADSNASGADRQAHNVANSSASDLDIIPIFPFLGYTEWHLLRRGGLLRTAVRRGAVSLGNGIRAFVGESALAPSAGFGIFPILVLPESFNLLDAQIKRARGHIDGPT